MSPIRYQVGPRGRHRKPRQPRTNRLIRGGLLSGVVGTVAVTGATTPASAATQGANETTAELRALDGVLAHSASLAAEATQEYATDAEARQTRERAQQRAIADAQRDAAERRERQERREAARRAAAAEARAQARAQAEAEAEAAAEAEAEAAAEARTNAATTPAPESTGTGAAAVVDYVRAQLGDAYALGATGTDAWDCSSLTQAAFASVGVSLPRVAADQSVTGTQVSLDALLPGDILYWGGAGAAYHVAVYAGDGTFIGAQNSSTGVVENTLDWDPPSGAVRVL